MKKKWAERVFSLFLMALAVSAFWQTLSLPKPKTTTSLLTQAAFFPQWLAILLFICSAIPFARTFVLSGGDMEKIALPPIRMLLRLSLFIALVCGILLLIPSTGWLVAQLALVFLIEMLFERRRWTQSLAIAVISTIVIYALFELALGVRLPRGIFE